MRLAALVSFVIPLLISSCQVESSSTSGAKKSDSTSEDTMDSPYTWTMEPCPRDLYPIAKEPDSCVNDDAMDMVDTKQKTCSDLKIKLGDHCPTQNATCIVSWPKTCKSGLFKSPSGDVSNSGYLGGEQRMMCRDESIPANCPISQAKAKQNIRYLNELDQERYAKEILGIKLASYEYRPEYSSVPGPQLGFIIDDNTKSPILTQDGGHVNLYAYLSAVVATVQKQEREIQALKGEIRHLQRNRP